MTEDEFHAVAKELLVAIVGRQDCEYDMVAQDGAVSLAYAYARAYRARRVGRPLAERLVEDSDAS